MTTPMGGARLYWPDGTTTEYYSSSTATYDTDGGGSMLGYSISYPSGNVDTYHYIVDDRAFLTAHTDPAGHSTSFNYLTTNNITYLITVVDTDGRTNTLSYTNTAFPAQVTSVTDPFNRTAHLLYDTNGVLTNITDVVGISSSFKYDTNFWVTNLITPYGTTKFTYTDYGDDGSIFTDDVVNRSVMIVDALGGTNLYLFREHSDFLPSSYTSDVPALASDANVSMDYHNSWFWGPRQAALLSTNDINSLTTNDFQLGRLRSWLHGSGGFANEISDQLSMQRDPSPDGVTEGHKTWYSYLDQSDDFAGTFPHPTGIFMVLPDGNDRNTTFMLDNFGRPTNIVETWSVGSLTGVLTRTNQYVYDSNGIDLVHVIGANGETVAGYAYNSNHQVVRVTNAVNDVTSYTYDAQGRLTSTHTPAGLTSTNIYFSSGDYTNWIHQRIDLETERTISFTYSNDLVFTSTDERGLLVTNTFDNLQRPTGWAFPDGTTITNIYDKLDLAQTIDRMGYTNSYGFDALRRLVVVTNALGNVTHYTYCNCGSVDSVTDALNNTTLFSYDYVGHCIAIQYPDQSGITNKFDFLGRSTNVLNGNASITNWYTHAGRVAASSNALGQIFLRQYDAENRVTNFVDQNGVTMTNAYDALGRLLVRGFPADGAKEQVGYSSAGLVAYTNQLGYTTYYGYDPEGRKVAETNANAEVTQFSYNYAGDLTEIIDGNAHSTKWGYDIYGHVTSKTNANNDRILAYAYDANGRMTNRWNLEKGNTFYKYDADGNLTNVTYATSPSVVFCYDAENHLTSMSDAIGITSFDYTETGLPKSENGPWDDDTVSYTYTDGRRQQLSLLQPYGQAWAQSYTYDSANRIGTITSPAGTFTYSYIGGLNSKITSSALVKRLLLPNGAYETNVFDTLGRITFHRLKKSDGFTVLEQDNPSYDLANRRTFTTSMECEKTLGYDHIGQLISDSAFDIAGDEPSRMNEQLSYSYDAAGNLRYRTNNTVVENFQVNNLNELTTNDNSGAITVFGTTTSRAFSVTVNGTNADLYEDNTFAATNMPRVSSYTAVASDGKRSDTNIVSVNISTNVTFAYDGNGNMLSDGLHSYEWNDENELTAIYVTNTWRSEFVYDGKLRRRIEKDFKWGGSSWTQTNEVRFVYDNNLIIQHRDGNNRPTVTLTRGKALSGSLDGAGGIGGLLAMTEATTLNNPQLSTSYYHSDANGNVTMLISSAQAVVAKYLYDPFGNTLSSSGCKALVNVYRFSSKAIHQLSTAYDYLFRFYQPRLQRWLNRDPLEEWGDIDVYRFVRNGAANQVDANGLTVYPAPPNPDEPTVPPSPPTPPPPTVPSAPPPAPPTLPPTPPVSPTIPTSPPNPSRPLPPIQVPPRPRSPFAPPWHIPGTPPGCTVSPTIPPFSDSTPPGTPPWQRHPGGTTGVGIIISW